MESASYNQYLHHSELFQGLEQDAIQAAADSARIRRVKSGAFFFHQGDPARVLYVLIEGHVKFTQITPEGQQVLLRVIEAGETFGAVAALGDAFHPASARAIGNCVALGWESEVISGLMEQFPRLALNAVRFLAGRVEEFQDRYRELSTERVERRLAHALLRLARQLGKEINSGVFIDLALSRQDIAEMAGTTLYTSSRTLSAWEQQGFIMSQRGRLLVLKPDNLQRIADDSP